MLMHFVCNYLEGWWIKIKQILEFLKILDFWNALSISVQMQLNRNCQVLSAMDFMHFEEQYLLNKDKVVICE